MAPRPTRTVPRWRRSAVRIGFAALVFACVAAAAEGAARLWGHAPAQAPSPLPFQDVARQHVSAVPGGLVWPFGRARVATHPKPGVRVQLIGESAAEGDGYVPFVAMGGVMERALRHALPGPVDVLDLGSPGAGSRQLVEVVREALRAEPPDVIVFYVGNNELHELRALKTVVPGYSAREERLRRTFWRSYAYREAVMLLVPPPSPVAIDPRAWPTLGQFATLADADDRALAMLFYEENLRTMVGLARDAGVAVVVSTVAVNERGLHLQPLSDTQRALVAEADTLARSDPAAARARIRDAESVAERPMQALPETWAVAARVAADTGSTFCDPANTLGLGWPLDLPGSELFDDPCHPNPAGHLAIGTQLAACVLRALGHPDAASATRPIPVPADPRRLDGYTARREVDVPDDGTADTALRRGNAAVARKELTQAATAYTAAAARGADPALVALDVGLLDLYRADLPGARTELATAARLLPADPDVAAYVAAVGAP